ncbi:unnamed protein product [Leptosia nina]|uniref:Uncharacterized protein n=1 Tax=Leptosia nina TaxID=320188 RepID=A0AAV1JX52_9NEOP
MPMWSPSYKFSAWCSANVRVVWCNQVLHLNHWALSLIGYSPIAFRVGLHPTAAILVAAGARSEIATMWTRWRASLPTLLPNGCLALSCFTTANLMGPVHSPHRHSASNYQATPEASFDSRPHSRLLAPNNKQYNISQTEN